MSESLNISARLVLAWLSWLYSFSLGEGYAGDLEEEYCYCLENRGSVAAGFWLFNEALGAIPVFTGISLQWSYAMFSTYIKTFFRSLKQHKSTAVINWLGLTLGIFVFLVIGLFVQNERQFDRFHTDWKRIYRLVDGEPSDKESWGGTPAPLGKALQDNFPEIESVLRMERWPLVVRVGNRSCREDRVLLADSTFFSFFSFPLLEGDEVRALEKPNAIVLTQSSSRKYFGDEPALGKVLQIRGFGDFIVTAIAADVPEKSHFHFDFVIPFHHVGSNIGWSAWNYFTYVKVREATNARDLYEKSQTHFKDHELKNTIKSLYYQPLSDIHFQYNRSNLEPSFNGQFLWVLEGLALVVLLMACLNYINLSTAYVQRRIKEVGVKKAVGVTRGQVMRQFLHESFFMALMALLSAIGLVLLIKPYLSAFAGRLLEVPWSTFSFWAVLAAILLVVGLLSGLYPAVIVSKIQPAAIINGLARGRNRGRLRAVLVVVQFTAAVALGLGAVMIYRQMTFIQHADLGYQQEALITLRLNSALRERSPSLRNQFAEMPEVVAASVNSQTVNEVGWCQSVYWEGQREDQRTSFFLVGVDSHYFETMQINFLEGGERLDRSLDRTNRRSYFVLNKAALDHIGWDKGYGKLFDLNNDPINGEVLAVTDNFHYRSLHHAVVPLGLVIIPQGSRLTLRLQTADLAASLKAVEKRWQQLVPGFEFDYEFVDDRLSASYRNEQKLGQLMAVFTLLALLIACLGLVSLATFTAGQKTKEIGIRKVLGASVGGLTLRMCTEFVRWVILANLFALPLAWWFMSNWLQNFEYRADMNWTIFVLSALFSLLMAIISVAFQAMRAARINPVHSLKCE